VRVSRLAGILGNAAQVALLAMTLSALILAALFAERRHNEAVLRTTLESAKQAQQALQASNRLSTPS
jgi:hypothetical protein